MKKKAFTLPELLTVGVPIGTAIGTANYMAYKHNPEGYKRGGGIGALVGAATTSGLGYELIGRTLRGSGSAKQKALTALSQLAVLAAMGGTFGGETGALGGSVFDKQAAYIGSFDPMDYGVGLSTRSRDMDYNNSFDTIYGKSPLSDSTRGLIDSNRPSITRIRHSDGRTTYRVSRRLLTPYKDRAGRDITHNFSVDVDSPMKAMRLAKGHIRFANKTQTILDSIASSKSGFIGDGVRIRDWSGDLADLDKWVEKGLTRHSLGRFGLMTDSPGVDKTVKEVVRNVEKHRIHPVELLLRLAKLHPRSAKAIGRIGLSTAIGLPAMIWALSKKD